VNSFIRRRGRGRGKEGEKKGDVPNDGPATDMEKEKEWMEVLLLPFFTSSPEGPQFKGEGKGREEREKLPTPMFRVPPGRKKGGG